MVSKMIDAFKKAEGGLFSKVAKADVGGGAAELQKKGITLMCWADPFYPDQSLPEHIVKATVDSIVNGSGAHYTMPIGNPELKALIAKRLKKYNDLSVDPLRNIIITPGSDAGLFFTMLPFIDKGDEVMIIDPSYPNNYQNVEICGGVIVRIRAAAETNFHPPIEEFEKRLTKKTKLVVLTNPNNPTTTVYRREYLKELAGFIVKNDLIAVVDQAFEYPVFDGIEMVTLAALPGMWERTVTVFSLSKGMGLSGYRVGYAVADDRIMDKLCATAVSVIGAANTAAQMGAIAAMQDDGFLKEYAKIHLNRRDMAYEILKNIPGTKMLKSESGFLTWMNISRLGTSQEVVDYLIDKARVAVNVGEPYGECGKGHIRIVHGVLGGDDMLKDALCRIREGLCSLAAQKGVK